MLRVKPAGPGKEDVAIEPPAIAPDRPASTPRLGLVKLSLLAVAVGIVGGIGAVVFRGLIALVHNAAFLGTFSVIYDANVFTAPSPWGAAIIIAPVIGSLVVTGLALGMLGAGGTIIGLPIFLYLGGPQGHAAFGTNALGVTVIAFLLLLWRIRGREVDLPLGIAFTLPGLVGIAIGARLGLLYPAAAPASCSPIGCASGPSSGCLRSFSGSSRST